jgi:hemerythrin-like domain-containing protein
MPMLGPGAGAALTCIKRPHAPGAMLPAMRHTTIDVINEEHQALAAMLRSLNLLLAQARQEHRAPDFDVLRAMLLYVDEFPERLHHRKETELLFPKVRQRCPDLAPVLYRLERDHEAGERSIRALEHALLAYEVLGEPRRDAFEQHAAHYTRFYLEHMALEESEVLPAARSALLPEDWAELDAAFAAHRDPLTGFEASAAYRPLFQKILMTAPAPIGLGPSR